MVMIYSYTIYNTVFFQKLIIVTHIDIFCIL
nr:MAG TPA: hypothetical protein [Caudoviricetes sp.]